MSNVVDRLFAEMLNRMAPKKGPRYSELLRKSGLEEIGRQAAQAETGASWNYYSQYGGTGFETPQLRTALYAIGRKRRRAEDNLRAYTDILRRREDLQDKWAEAMERLEMEG